MESKHAEELSCLRVEKSKVEGICDQAIQDKQRLQEWTDDHLNETRERLSSSQMAVQAAEGARADLEDRCKTAEGIVTTMREQMRRLARDSAMQQQEAAEQLEQLHAVATANQERLNTELTEAASSSAQASQKVQIERSKRDEVERRLAQQMEVAHLAQMKSVRAMEDAETAAREQVQSKLGDMIRTHRQDMDGLRMENAKLQGSYEHSVSFAFLASTVHDAPR